ncbi:MAG TPA: VC0807 family protein [Candidatus Dormibacteraeota bacterium]|jgi:hypothetical protein|nr:VC0807 family protein [Candidatus Dormibacteraeota bacterium]
MLQRPGGIGFRVATIAAGGLAPLAIYFVLHSRGMGDTEALALAWFAPVLWTLGSSIWRRRIDPLSLIGVAAYGLALGAAVFLGAGDLPLKLQRAVLTGAIGIVCLASFAIRRPILVVLVRRVARSRGVDAAIGPEMVGRLGHLTLIAGIGLMGNCALHAATAILLPTPTFLLASAGIHVVAVAGVALGAVFVFRFRPRSLGVSSRTEDPDHARA